MIVGHSLTSEIAQACELKHRFTAGLDWLRSHRDSQHLDDGIQRITLIAVEYLSALNAIRVVGAGPLQAEHDDLLERVTRGWESTHPESAERFAERLTQYEVICDALQSDVFAHLFERIDRACRN